MKQIRFNTPGKWAQHLPYLPQFEVKSGDIKQVPKDITMETAESAVKAGKAEWVTEPVVTMTTEEALKLAKTIGKPKGKKRGNKR
jgi:hypothetical protein